MDGPKTLQQIVSENPGDLKAQRQEILAWNQRCLKAMEHAKQVHSQAKTELVGTNAMLDLLDQQIGDAEAMKPEEAEAASAEELEDIDLGENDPPEEPTE